MLRATLAAALFLAALAPALATAEEGAVTLNVTVEGDAYAFTIEGFDGENPALELAAGSTVTATFTNNGESAHNLVFGAPISKGTEMLEPGASETITFTVPASASGSTTYYCEPHQFQGMEGQVALKAAENPPPTPDPTSPSDPPQEAVDDEGANGIPAPHAPLAALAAGAVAIALARRRG